MGFFVAGEGRRSYGRTTTASMPHRTVLTLRRPVGVAALLISFNTPLPNVAWKAFPSIFCGNGSVLKPSEHTPVSAWWLGRLCLEAGLPPGVLNVVQGLGPEAGMPLVEDPRVDLVSFTGSAATGRLIAEAAGRRLAKTVMELGGKNALVVCDDADLDRAVEWTLASAFSNAGQRCAAASRIVVFDAVYDDFRERLARATWALGDIGPVISEAAMDRILAAVEAACAGGAVVLAGGARVGEQGFHVAPTLVEGVAPDAPLSCEELFGPVAALYRVAGFDEAVALANDSPYGLTAAIHTASVHRAMQFAERVAAGRRRRQRRDARQRAAHGLRRGQAVRDGVEGGGPRVARRLLGDAVREPGRRPRAHVTRPVAVLGIGGVGGMLAVRTGALCVGTERTVAAIRGSGLTLVHGETTTVAHPEAVERLETPVGLLVVAVKAHDLDDALDRIAPEALAGAVVLPLLNGLEHVDAIRERFEARGDSPELVRRRAGSIGRLEAFSSEPGVVVQRSAGNAVVNAASRELDQPALDAALEPLRVPGIDVVLGDDERAVLWEKAARLAVLAAATVASGLAVGPLRADEAWRPRLVEALGEACAVAAADGVALDAAAQWAIIEAMPDDLTTSAARDAASGRPTELDAITGSVVRAGARLGVPTPALASLLEEAACRAR